MREFKNGRGDKVMQACCGGAQKDCSRSYFNLFNILYLIRLPSADGVEKSCGGWAIARPSPLNLNLPCSCISLFQCDSEGMRNRLKEACHYYRIRNAKVNSATKRSRSARLGKGWKDGNARLWIKQKAQYYFDIGLFAGSDLQKVYQSPSLTRFLILRFTRSRFSGLK
jgi:hypothetical protein